MSFRNCSGLTCRAAMQELDVPAVKTWLSTSRSHCSLSQQHSDMEHEKVSAFKTNDYRIK